MKRAIFWIVALLVIGFVALWAVNRQASTPQVVRHEAVFPEPGSPLAEEHGANTLVWRGTIRGADRAGSWRVTVTARDGESEWTEQRTIDLDADEQREVVVPLSELPAEASQAEVEVRIEPVG